MPRPSIPGLRSPLPCLALCAALVSCTATPPGTPAIPGPAPTVRRSEATAIAYAYTQVDWRPEARHLRHGPDRAGVIVHTPDAGLKRQGFSNGWWQVGQAARGMPYQWGGFDTPREFLASLDRGEATGDISTPLKRRLGDAGVSHEACGIDCSGFVSRCWRLAAPCSTAQLPTICDRLADWRELQPGDIALNDRHVLLFAGWQKPGVEGLYYEAGPRPVWRVNAAGISVDFLRARGYTPWRYRKIRD